MPSRLYHVGTHPARPSSPPLSTLDPEKSLRGFHRLLASIEKTRQRLNPGLAIFGVLPTIHNPRASHDRATLERMQAELDRLRIHLFPPVNRSTSFDQGMDHQKATIVFAPATPGAAVYMAVADELLSHKSPTYA